MAPKGTEHLDQFRESLKDWVDERFLTRDELEALAMFSLYLVNLADDDGWVYDGHTLKVGSPLSCLVVKATIEGVPHVVFTSGRTTTACVRIFLRKLSGDMLEWVPDKYR